MQSVHGAVNQSVRQSYSVTGCASASMKSASLEYILFSALAARALLLRLLHDTIQTMLDISATYFIPPILAFSFTTIPICM